MGAPDDTQDKGPDADSPPKEEADSQTEDTGADEGSEAYAPEPTDQTDANVVELQGRLDQAEQQLAGIQSQMTKGQEAPAKKEDDPYADDPAMKKLEKVTENQNAQNAQMTAIQSTVQSLRNDIDAAKDERATAQFTGGAITWLKEAIQKDSLLRNNPVAQKNLLKDVDSWARGSFDPKKPLMPQLRALQQEVAEWRERWGPALATGSPTKAEPKEDKRADALERDAHERASIAASGSPPPTKTEEKRATTGAEIYSALMEEWDAGAGRA